MQPDLSAIVYVAIAIILLITFYNGHCGGGTCG